MGGAKRIKLAFGTLWKTAQSTHLPQGLHALASAGQDFVRVGLMAHIPHHPVFRRIEHIVQGHSELHRTEVGAQVPAGFGDAAEQKGTQFRRQSVQFGPRQAP